MKENPFHLNRELKNEVLTPKSPPAPYSRKAVPSTSATSAGWADNGLRRSHRKVYGGSVSAINAAERRTLWLQGLTEEKQATHRGKESFEGTQGSQSLVRKSDKPWRFKSRKGSSEMEESIFPSQHSCFSFKPRFYKPNSLSRTGSVLMVQNSEFPC